MNWSFCCVFLNRNISDVTDADDEAIEANERSSLLPPSGISTNEKDGNNRRGGSGRRRKDYRSSSATKQTTDEMGSTARIDDRTAGGMMAQAAKVSFLFCSYFRCLYPVRPNRTTWLLSRLLANIEKRKNLAERVTDSCRAIINIPQILPTPPMIIGSGHKNELEC